MIYARDNYMAYDTHTAHCAKRSSRYKQKLIASQRYTRRWSLSIKSSSDILVLLVKIKSKRTSFLRCQAMPSHSCIFLPLGLHERQSLGTYRRTREPGGESASRGSAQELTLCPSLRDDTLTLSQRNTWRNVLGFGPLAFLLDFRALYIFLLNREG